MEGAIDQAANYLSLPPFTVTETEFTHPAFIRRQHHEVMALAAVGEHFWKYLQDAKLRELDIQDADISAVQRDLMSRKIIAIGEDGASVAAITKNFKELFCEERWSAAGLLGDLPAKARLASALVSYDSVQERTVWNIFSTVFPWSARSCMVRYGMAWHF